MRRLIRTRLHALPLFALLGLLALGCEGDGGDGTGAGDGSGAGNGGGDGTATLVGALHTEEGAPSPEALDLDIDGEPRTVPVGPDRHFTARGVPTGDTEVVVEAAGIRARVTLTDVRPDELIELDVTLTRDSLSLHVVRRSAAPPPPPDPVLRVVTGDIEITDNNVTYHLEPAIYEGDIVVRGNNVRLVGYYEGVCDPALQTVVEGSLEVRGNNVSLIDVYVLGGLEVRGNGFESWRSCPGPGAGF